MSPPACAGIDLLKRNTIGVLVSLPACAGIDPTASYTSHHLRDLPPVRGDRPRYKAITKRYKRSPRVRGDRPRLWQSRGCRKSVSRVRGDRPDTLTAHRRSRLCLPSVRGSTSPSSHSRLPNLSPPARDLPDRLSWPPGPRASPPACAGIYSSDEQAKATREGSPRVRDLSSQSAEFSRCKKVSPACAGSTSPDLDLARKLLSPLLRGDHTQDTHRA